MAYTQAVSTIRKKNVDISERLVKVYFFGRTIYRFTELNNLECPVHL